MITKVEGKCQYAGCEKDATQIAIGRKAWDDPASPLACYCDEHGERVTDEGSPEYTVPCPNCGCRFGIN